jgi:hypothetical protein
LDTLKTDKHNLTADEIIVQSVKQSRFVHHSQQAELDKMCAICAVFGGDEDDTAKFMTGFLKMRHRGPDAFRIESTSITSVETTSL